MPRHDGDVVKRHETRRDDLEGLVLGGRRARREVARQHDFEDRRGVTAPHAHPAAVCLSDLLDDVEAEPGTTRGLIGAHEWREDRLANLCRDGPGILDLDTDCGVELSLDAYFYGMVRVPVLDRSRADLARLELPRALDDDAAVERWRGVA